MHALGSFVLLSSTEGEVIRLVQDKFTRQVEGKITRQMDLYSSEGKVTRPVEDKCTRSVKEITIHNTTLLPSGNTIALVMFFDAKYTHFT